MAAARLTPVTVIQVVNNFTRVAAEHLCHGQAHLDV